MDDDKILELTGKIEETLGKEDYAMISDTIGEILTGNSQNMKSIADRDAKIKNLEDKNEKLVAANGSLLLKLPMVRGSDDEEDNSKKKEAPKLSLKDAFDAKGNFIH